MRLLFVHSSFGENGVTRSTLNTIRGLKELSRDIKFVMLANSFSSSLPDYIDKIKIDNWDSPELLGELEKNSEDADFIIIENPTVGIFPLATKVFKEFAERNESKNIIYRMHDFVDDRPHLFDEFSKVFENLDVIYPRTSNVTFLVLNSYDKSRLVKKGIKDAIVMPNSIITEELVPDMNKAAELRQALEKDKIVKPKEKIILYPVRVLKRKNIEEAMLITKILSSEKDYRLIVTLPLEEDYEKELRELAREYKIKCSIGEVGKYIGFEKSSKFTISELYAISDLVVSTSVREGFGFVFLEPWISGTPLIGRKIPEITQDFEANGINLKHMYDNSVFFNNESYDYRMNKIKSILSDDKKLSELSRNLHLQDSIKTAFNSIDSNKKQIKENYDYKNVAGRFMELFSMRIPIPFNLN